MIQPEKERSTDKLDNGMSLENMLPGHKEAHRVDSIHMKCLAGCGGSHLKSQHFGRLRWVDHEVKSSRPAWPTW